MVIGLAGCLSSECGQRSCNRKQKDGCSFDRFHFDVTSNCKLWRQLMTGFLSTRQSTNSQYTPSNYSGAHFSSRFQKEQACGEIAGWTDQGVIKSR
jgi:hypothetical protein